MRGIGHEHDTEATDDAVDRPVREVDRRCVLDPELDVFDPELGGTPARRGDHLGSEVGREQQSIRAERLRCDEARVAGTGSELEHRLAWNWIEERHEALVEVARRLTGTRRLALPASSRRVPGRDLLVLGGSYVATSASSGMMSRP